MKKVIVAAVTCFVSLVLQAQCDIYIPMKKGTAYEMTMYNDRDKVSGTVTYFVKEVMNDGQDAEMANEVKNEKGKLLSTSNYTIHCQNGQMSIDLKSMIPAQTLDGYKDMDIKANGNGVLLLPANLSVGQTLPDATSSWDISSKGTTTIMTTLSISITNRQVVSKESIVTPAGTYDCFNITANMKMVTAIMGMEIPFEVSSEEYYCPGVGLVKSVSYSKSGKLQGYNVLSKITNN